MKKSTFKRTLCLALSFVLISVSLIGCVNNTMQKNVEYNEEGKMVLKIQRFNSSLEKSKEDEEYENSMVMKNETVSITGLIFDSIEKGKLSDYEEKYAKIVEYIKSEYSDFDIQSWSIMVNMYSADDGNGMIRLNYQIKDIIDTNKAILFIIENNVIDRVTFINMDFNIDENELVNLVNDFKNSSIQEKKELTEGEEFLKEDVTYTYRYNTDELIYTYQLFFYQQLGSDPNEKIINNEYGTEYVINKG